MLFRSDPEKLGHKALAVNLSDMAAMGALPRWATLSLALPQADEKWVAAFMRGFMRLARKHDVDLVGGDKVVRANLCARSTDYGTYLANKQQNEFNTYVRLNTALPSRLRPKK